VSSKSGHSTDFDIWMRDPQPITPFEIVDESGLLRLRRYSPGAVRTDLPPVLLVYPVIKRPFVLDLLPERSVVRSLLRKGIRVYLTDWVPPGIDDHARGFAEYADQDLARAVDRVCELEGVSQAALIGICCGGLFAAVYAALNPQRVSHVVTLAAPFEIDPPVTPLLAEQIVYAWRNVPPWMIQSALNTRMRDPHQTAFQLARDLGEPDLAEHRFDDSHELVRALRPWLASDVPLAGRLFLEVVRDALPNSNLLADRLRVGDRKVELRNIDCPVLVVAGNRDALVPARCTTRFARLVGDRDAGTRIFPTGHLGLMLSLAAHRKLWPEVAEWLKRRSGRPMERTA
jgi:polyhydroxyalkanoate synthase